MTESQDGNTPVEQMIRLKKYQHDLITAISVLNMETVEAYIQRAIIQSLHADMDGKDGDIVACPTADWKKRLANDGL